MRNVISSLASMVQELSQSFKKAQSKYLKSMHLIESLQIPEILICLLFTFSPDIEIWFFRILEIMIVEVMAVALPVAVGTVAAAAIVEVVEVIVVVVVVIVIVIKVIV